MRTSPGSSRVASCGAGGATRVISSVMSPGPGSAESVVGLTRRTGSYPSFRSSARRVSAFCRLVFLLPTLYATQSKHQVTADVLELKTTAVTEAVRDEATVNWKDV